MWLKTYVVQRVSEPLKTATLPSTVQILIYDVAEIRCAFFSNYQQLIFCLFIVKCFSTTDLNLFCKEVLVLR